MSDTFPALVLADGARHRPGPRRWEPLLAAAGVVALAVAATVGVVVGNGDDRAEVRSAGSGQQGPSTPEGAANVATNGRVPGQAVLVPDDPSGPELRTYGPDGAQTGTVNLAPLENVQAASSDLDGGWVVCGYVEEASPAGTTVPTDRLVWFPANREPVVVEAATPVCHADAVRVVGSADGPTAVYTSTPDGSPNTGPSVLFALHAVVLATGADREVDLPAPAGSYFTWSAAPGRVLVHDDDGVHLYDLGTGEALPTAPIQARLTDRLALAPDATSVAVLDGAADGPVDLVVYDLATGAERFRERFPMPAEGTELSYDGATVAVGNYDGDHAAVVTVIDLATGGRRTIDAHGILP